MSNFALALQTHLEALPEKGFAERRALRILAQPDSPHRTRFIERWEAGTRAAAGFDPSSIIDWLKSVDWVKVLQIALTILGFLLMFAAEAPTLMAGGTEDAGQLPPCP